MMKSVLTLVSGREDRVLRRIRISEIVRNPNQPRRYFDPEAIATLAESIRQYGVLNPLTVRRTANGGYELVAGERRLRDRCALPAHQRGRRGLVGNCPR